MLDSWDDIKVFDDNLDDLEIMRKIASQNDFEDPFHLLDVGDIIRKYKTWLEKLPKVVPYYAVKCNPNPTVIKILAALGASFDCASKQEIITVMSNRVSSDRVVFANPVKTPGQLRYSKKVGVRKMTADNMNELKKIKDLFPEAKVIIRVRCDAAITKVHLGSKFGCNSHSEALKLICGCRDLGLELVGFSFHVGSLCGEPAAMARGIRICRDLIEKSKFMGLSSARIIDIGGGFPSDSTIFEEFVKVVNDALLDLDPDIEVISEPGRYFVGSASKAAVFVHGKKTTLEGDTQKMTYYLNDGIYGSFYAHFLKVESQLPKLLFGSSRVEKKYQTTLWGPTCDSYDCIASEVYLPEYKVGDWLYWSNMGAYTDCFNNSFNGFSGPTVILVVRRSCWNSFLNKLPHKMSYSL